MIPVLAFIRGSRAAQIGLGALALLIALGIWLHIHDRKVIDRHEAGIEKRVGEATDAANEKADANDTKRQADNARADEQLRGAIDDAKAKHPDEVGRPAGPAVTGTLDRLRHRSPPARSPSR